MWSRIQIAWRMRPSHTARSGAHASTNRACGCSRAWLLVPLAGVAAGRARSRCTVQAHPLRARAWPPHPRRVVDMGETARTSCDRRSCLWQPLTRSCLRHPCVRRRRHESAPHGWCCSARITDALHAERTHGSIACAAESERVPHVQHHHPCPPSAARRSLDGAVRVGVGV